ncbi:MAG TPA: hypothetical protein P5294_07745 [Smithellaceae bacterium]|nr:hypothetical protein [Smithellaceae bacterium]HRV26415.1 hypothetical protein [Smithellaceae bacterium]
MRHLKMINKIQLNNDIQYAYWRIRLFASAAASRPLTGDAQIIEAP